MAFCDTASKHKKLPQHQIAAPHISADPTARRYKMEQTIIYIWSFGFLPKSLAPQESGTPETP
jgi:hypothetical protein